MTSESDVISPMKSSSSDSRRSQTTSMSEYSTFSSSTSSNKTQMEELRNRVKLLKTQLAQREKEMEKEKLEKEGETVSRTKNAAELKHLRLKSAALSAICEDLLEWMKTNENEEERRSREMEAIHQTNLRVSTATCTALKTENGKLKMEISVKEGKIAKIINENNYLRWENGSLTREVQAQKAEIETFAREKAVLKCESARVEGEMREMRKKQKDRVEQELQSVVQTTASKMEKVRRVHDDREKEYGLTLSRMNNEMQFLRDELSRKESLSSRLTQMLDKTTMENKKLFEENAELRRQSELEICQLRERLERREMEMGEIQRRREDEKAETHRKQIAVDQGIYHDVARKAMASKREEELREAQTVIQNLREQIRQLTLVNALDPTEVKDQLRHKSMRLLDLELRIEQATRECAEEREHRENCSILLAEMSRDMSTLIGAMKNC